MSERPRFSTSMIEGSLQSYRDAGGTDEACARRALQQAADHGGFAVGDEVVCGCGSLAGVILAFQGDDAVISWQCRGKSTEHLTDLVHAEHHNE